MLLYVIISDIQVQKKYNEQDRKSHLISSGINNFSLFAHYVPSFILISIYIFP